MTETLEFETPENITVNYDLAGMGTRFVAWAFDMLLLFIIGLVVFVVMGFSAWAIPELFPMGSGRIFGTLLGIVVTLLIGFSLILYFLLFEFFMHGQTPGKRSVNIRVVRADGFSLTFGALFIRNIFRVLDTMPLLWVVPVLSGRAQRFGDMVGGTVVVKEERANPDGAQMRLLRRSPSEAEFTFSNAQLGCLEEDDANAIAAFLERQATMKSELETRMRQRLVSAFAERLGVEPIGHDIQQRRFLEDLLAAYCQKQVRTLE